MATAKHSTAAAMMAMASVVITTFVVTALYVGREILIPLALAALLAFLLAPIVTWMEKFIGRIAAVLVAVAILLSAFVGVGWVLTHQVLELATQLPVYKENIQKKLRSLKMPGDGRFAEFNKAVAELQAELPGKTPPTPATTNESATGRPSTRASDPSLPPTPIPVEVVDIQGSTLLGQLAKVISPMIGPLGVAALVLLLLIFMLLQREDLRARIIRILGLGNISATTRGLDDAAQRVARYLLMQLVVNATYGIAVGIGLYFIGVPSAVVWGVFATVLRFIPYVGPWIAAAFPVALSLAVSDSWTMPLATIGLFLVLEIFSNNVMEPWLYGASTGVSSIALIVAAVFWTWLWGAPGLVLATPLTVCLVVMGRHVPRLSILAVLLSDEDALSPHEELYHRLLTPSANDASDFAAEYVKEHSLVALYDEVFTSALAAVERDCKSGELEDQQHAEILEEFREIIEDLGLQPVAALPKPEGEVEPERPEPGPPSATCRVLVLPVRACRDEIAGMMLTQLLRKQGFNAENLTAERTTGELLETAAQEEADALCVSIMPPSTVIHARYLCGKLRARFPKMRIVAAMWGAEQEFPDLKEKLKPAGADEVIFTFAEALNLFGQIALSNAAVEKTDTESSSDGELATR